MRKLTTKLLFAIISAAFALVALGTTTFAWFTLTNEAEISQFDAQITAGEGLEISLDGTNFYTTIPANVIQAKIKSLKVTLKDITSPNGIDMYPLGPQNPDTKIDYIEAPQGNESNPYIEFDLWVRSPVEGTVVKLSSVSFSSNTGDDTWTPDTIFVNAKGKLVVPYIDAAALKAAAPALKAAGIIKNYTLQDETLVSVTYGEGEDEDIFTVEDKVVFGPQAYYAHDALRLSISDGSTTVVYQNAETTTNTLLEEEPIPNGMVDYYKNKNGIDLIATYTSDENTITLPTTTEVTTNNKPLLTTLGDATVPTELTVRIWIEGWDPDTFNAILTQKIYVSLLLTSATSAS